MSLMRGNLPSFRGKFFRKFLGNFKNQNRCISTNPDDHPNILKSDSKDIVVPDATLPEIIYNKMQQFPNYIATESAATGKKYTFEQIHVKSKNLSKHLRHKFGLKEGDIVAFYMPNLPEYTICFLGALDARLIVTTMNHLYTPDEIAIQIIDASPKLIFTQSHLLNTLKSALKISNRDLPTIIVKDRQDESIPRDTVDFFELTDTAIDVPDSPPGNSADVAIIPYSSGTTGLPKGVQLCHKNLIANLLQIVSPDFKYLKEPSGDFQEITPAVLPFYHIFGMAMNFLYLYCGVRTVALAKFAPDTYIEALKKYRPTFISGAPPLVFFLTSHQDVKPEYLKNLRNLTSGAAPLGYSDEEKFLKKVGRSDVTIFQGYGLTETSPGITYFNKYHVRSEENSGSVGKLLPNTIMKIANVDDPRGEPLGVNQRGEILIKGPQVMKGYYKKPQETQNTFADGWLRTGDIGYYKEDKYIWISDRLKELIKVKGYQVAPAELEAVIRAFPSVEDAAVVGVPHAKFGEAPRAFVVPKKGVQFKPEELEAYVAEKVAPYKKLTGGIAIIDSIPKNPAGKILRKKIKEEFL
ncbi:unnamed protein product [Phyllotreta striolata]|uniref:Uncharacterized protein n=1 Tax=Phyllotreta striolata TaxID=444603 RepID=A0A9N9XR82_PHYSR|nr:unnamed protein product [Phyllotreta striolata]